MEKVQQLLNNNVRKKLCVLHTQNGKLSFSPIFNIKMLKVLLGREYSSVKFSIFIYHVLLYNLCTPETQIFQ